MWALVPLLSVVGRCVTGDDGERHAGRGARFATGGPDAEAFWRSRRATPPTSLRAARPTRAGDGGDAHL
jgi:hypothetical protein